MIDSDLISFCIPTYNRADSLRISLPAIIDLVKEYGFKVIISDNMSDDDTFNIVKQHKILYDGIVYIKQERNIGEKNFEVVLKASKSKYAILLGDSYLIVKSEFKAILDILALEKYQVVFLNGLNSYKGTEQGLISREYNNISDILNDIGAYIPLMCSSIFSIDLIENANFNRYYNTYFIQNGIIFDYLDSSDKVLCYWYAKNSLITFPKKGGWISSVMEIFVKHWIEFVLSLPPSIPLSVKLKCIKDHSKGSNLFTLRKLVNYRALGYISKGDYRKYKNYLSYYMTKQTILLFIIITVLPKSLFKNLKIIMGKK